MTCTNKGHEVYFRLQLFMIQTQSAVNCWAPARLGQDATTAHTVDPSMTALEDLLMVVRSEDLGTYSGQLDP
ncbi:hypothetical protein J6590_103386 [Homalodisca vitripennis]|nr:hypothetical protein J6590_103386 [Homalodisca vitripennis]